ncbi:MAG: hypothetical protein GEU83_11850 [Pseudonocardiaceae bacterium]|nr:hypothetical protein [Pseudonocardiaceae bacterium]
MALDSSNVNVAVTGAVSYAPVGTAAPTDANTVLPATTWRDVGYLSSDGITETRDRSTNNVVAWQNAEVVRTVVTESSISVSFTMIESNPNSLELFYGTAVDDTDGSVTIDPGETGGRRAIVVDYVDGDRYMRLFLPQAEVTEVGESSLTSGDPVGYEVTLTGYPDSALGYSAKKFHSDLVVAAGV